MGGCASRPKDLDLENESANAPVDVPEPAAEETVAAVDTTPAVVEKDVEAKPETVTQEKTEEVEAIAPLVDLSEPAVVEAPKTEETKEAKEEVVPVETESKPTESEAKVVAEANEEKKEAVA